MSTAADNPNLNPMQQALLSSAAAVDQAVAPVLTVDEQGNPIEEPAAQQTADDPISRNRDFLAMGIGMLTPMLPFLPQCYTPEVIDQIAAAFTAVEIKRGWNLGEHMTPELALAMAALPPSVAAFMLGREYLAAKRAEKTAQKGSNQKSAFGDVANEHSQ
ncbi:hypothetical protein [Herbaspirillum huttiense]|uniref:hypothetical protein n=1 Tax=Herbaspirillum huttiense TaxID=863372 RepID=UPI003F408963